MARALERRETAIHSLCFGVVERRKRKERFTMS